MHFSAPAAWNPSLALTLLFAAALLLGLALKLWLATRQIRHVAQHRDRVPQPFTSQVALAAHQKAADYTIAKVRFALIETAVSTIALLGWTLLGGLDALNQALLIAIGPGLPHQLALVACFAGIGGLIELPLSWYRTFVLEERYGFNQTTPKLWLSDLFKSVVLGLLIGLPVVALVLGLMQAAGPTWWLWAWGVWVGFNLLLWVIYPTFIAPWFNRFQPLEDVTLRERVNRLLQRSGFSARGLYVMDGSRRSAHANAYFTGLGKAKRVVFFDTLLTKLTPAEIDAVLAHELGHFKHRHILQRMVSLFALSLLGFALLGWLMQQPWFYSGLGVTPSLHRLVPAAAGVSGPDHAVALLLFLLVIPVFSFFITPLWTWFSRQHEFEADAYAATQTDGKDLASALLKLYQDNAATLTPDPLYVAFHYSHPPATQRLARLST